MGSVFWSPFPHRRAAGGGHSLMGRSVGRGLDPSVGVYGRHGACPPPRGRGRAYPARGFSRGWAAAEGFRGVGDAAPYVSGCPLTGCRANLRRGAGTPPYGCRGGLYAAREFMWDAVLRLLFFFQHWAAIRLKMYPRCRAWTFDNRLHPTLFSVQLHLCF